MITNKDIRVENGFLIINGDKFPLDGQSPETIMDIVEDNSDTTPTENSTAPVTSGGVFTADKAISDTIGDITQTGITGSDVAAQIKELNDRTNITDNISAGANITINKGIYVRTGDLVTLYLSCTTTDNIAADAVVCNVPSNVIPNTPLSLFVNSSIVAAAQCRIYNGSVRTGYAMNSGTNFTIQGIYAATALS